MATGIIQFLESQSRAKLGEEMVNLLSLFEVGHHVLLPSCADTLDTVTKK